ncbi:MAG TPA: molecular chaperone [Spongiibacteraceae bacterium]|nr:molecular chaperone [Spongiibacteraceae bacterium]
MTAVYAGLDFGTTNSLLGVWEAGAPKPIKLEGDNNFIPSCMYTPKQTVDVLTPNESEIQRRVAAIRREQGTADDSSTDEKLTALVRAKLLRELHLAETSRLTEQTLDRALRGAQEVYFGEQALEKHIEDPLLGFFTKSPKPFFGSRLEKNRLDIFTEITRRMLNNIKTIGERQLQTSIDKIVIGRPVNFNGLQGEAGNRQALTLLELAARAAGFNDIEFLYEPVAAALDYERQLTRDINLLVLDVGGGTTDCALIKVGPNHRDRFDRSGDILGISGVRVGGMDLDMQLALHNIFPAFGKGTHLKSGLPVPSALFFQAAAINDVNYQRDFASGNTLRSIQQLLRDSIEPDKLTRLLTLQTEKLTYRLNRSAELAKIQLSEHEQTLIALPYVEADLELPISRADLATAIEKTLQHFCALMDEAVGQAGIAPDAIYVTGGTAKSPLVYNFVRARYPDAEIITGDLFGGVVAGLTTWAARIYC